MNKVLCLLIVLSGFTTLTQAKNRNKLAVTTMAAPNKVIKGAKFSLLYQAFSSHDAKGTDIDTVKHPGDFIYFDANGVAYMEYKGNPDSLNYRLIGKDSLSFGDTPFRITALGNGYYSLYQNEEEPNGDYNRVTYMVKKEEPEQTVSKR